MGIFDMFVNQQKKTEEIMSKDLEKYVTASMQPIDSDLLEIKEKLDTYKGNSLSWLVTTNKLGSTSFNFDSKFVVQKKHKKPFLANVLNIFCGLSIG